jgi:integrase
VGRCIARRNWLNPYLGDKPLASVDNAAVKELVSTLKEAKLSAKTIAEIVGVTKWIVASAIDANGKQKHPREWNHDFMDLPVVDADKQDRPTLDAEEVAACITKATGRYAVLYALLAGTGLRVGEALAIHVEPGDHTTISPDCKTIHVRKSIWNGKEQEPKTPAAKRAVDLSDDLAAYLKSTSASARPVCSFKPIHESQSHKATSSEIRCPVSECRGSIASVVSAMPC